MPLTTTRIALPEPAGTLRRLSAHLAQHHAVVSGHDGATLIVLNASSATLTASDEHLDVTVEAPDLASLHEMRFAIASHVIEFAPKGSVTALRWAGDSAGPALLPDFRVLAAEAVEQLTPHMRRIRFRGEDLSRFDTLEALHVRLFIPPAGLVEPAWPMIGEDGLLRQPPADIRPAIRKYTIREIDAAAGTLAIDFVLHDDAGPGSAFALRARPGDRIGMAGPGGRGLREAERYVFLADETGLPAVARMLAALPADAQGQAFLEVADAGEEQAFAAPAEFSIRWLHRAGRAPGAMLQEAFEMLDWPTDGPGTYLWGAMEDATFRSLRAAARQHLRPDRDQQLIVSYWRRGLSEEQHAAQKRAAVDAS